MQYDVKNPKEYFNALDNDWRKDRVEEIRDMILSYAPELREDIKYRMLVYGDVFGLNAQKNFVALYVGDIAKIPDSDFMLEPFNLGKGCIRIRKTLDISKTRLKEFIEKTIDLSRAHEDIAC